MTWKWMHWGEMRCNACWKELEGLAISTTCGHLFCMLTHLYQIFFFSPIAPFNNDHPFVIWSGHNMKGHVGASFFSENCKYHDLKKFSINPILSIFFCGMKHKARMMLLIYLGLMLHAQFAIKFFLKGLYMPLFFLSKNWCLSISLIYRYSCRWLQLMLKIQLKLASVSFVREIKYKMLRKYKIQNN